MASFLEKLKQGMDIEEDVNVKDAQNDEVEDLIKEEAKAEPIIKVKRGAMKKKSKPVMKKKKIVEKPVSTPLPKEELEELEPTLVSQKIPEGNNNDKWFEAEGELAVDVYQTSKEFVIMSAVAGINVENIEISVENDMVAIRGKRDKPKGEEGEYFFQECFWGPFSREVILPSEVDAGRCDAKMQDGVLMIRIPKILREKKHKVDIKTI